MRTLFIVFLGVCLFTIEPVRAFAKPNIALKLSGSTIELDASHKQTFVPLGARHPLPGERIRWEILITNVGNQVAKNVSAAGKIAATTSYIARSATGDDAQLEFSTDEAKTWSRAHEAKQNNDGPTAAPAYTSIRWISSTPLAPGASRRYRYDVLVR